jgi:hypothetical protein
LKQYAYHLNDWISEDVAKDYMEFLANLRKRAQNWFRNVSVVVDGFDMPIYCRSFIVANEFKNTVFPPIVHTPASRRMMELHPKSDTHFIKNLVKREKIVIYSKSWCPQATHVKNILKEKGVEYTVFEVDWMDNGE